LLSEHQFSEIQKMLLCHDPSQGYATYECKDCKTRQTVHFSCNSRLCPSCGRRLTEEWANRIKSHLLGCTHRHCVFTLPNELWSIMEKDRRLIQVAFKEILTVVKNVFKEQLRGIAITPGITAVLHTFGEDLKFNVHFHCIVTSGGVNDCGDWVKLNFFFYEGLRKVWQYHVLTAIKKALSKSWENNRLIDKMFKDHSNGFYVYAKDEINNDKGLLKYIARYVRHPAIAQSRITSFDGETVTFLCKKDEEGKQRKIEMPVQQFLLALAQHIPPKGFQMTKHLGLYANRSRKRYASVISMFLKVVRISQKKLLEHTPHCKKCLCAMELIEIKQTSVPPPALLLSNYYGQLKLRVNA